MSSETTGGVGSAEQTSSCRGAISGMDAFRDSKTSPHESEPYDK